MNWYVLYTRSRFEKKVEEDLNKNNIEAYCPKRWVEKQWSDRKKMVEEPLFRSYVFVKMLEHQKYDILNTNGVVKFIHFKGDLAKIREEEIDRIKAILNQFDHNHLRIDHLESNQMVTIASGAFIDRHGRVLETKGNKTIILLEELGLRIEVDQIKNILQKNQPNSIINRNFVQQKV